MGEPTRTRQFRRLEEREQTHESPPKAAVVGLAKGAVCAVAFTCVEGAVACAADIPLPPASELGWVLAAMAGVGAVLGMLTGITGLWGARWASAFAVTTLGWLAGAPLAGAMASTDVPAVVGFGFAVTVGFVMGQVLGRAPARGWMHSGIAVFLFVAAAVAAPLSTLLPNVSGLPSIVVWLAALFLATVCAGIVMLLTGDGRAPILPVVAVGLAGALVCVAAAPDRRPMWNDAEGSAAPIVVVVVSGLRRDRTAAGGAQRPIAEHLDRFARGAVRFGSARATSNWTVPSLGSILTGRLPYGHGAGLHDGRAQRHTPLRADVITVATALQRQGWSTAGVVADPALQRYWLDAGFSVWWDEPDRGVAPALWRTVRAAELDPTGWPLNVDAETVAERARTLIAAQDGGSWLLLVQFGDAAGPFDPRPEDEEAVGYTTRGGQHDRYDAALRRIDHAFAHLIEAVPRDAWVVVVADRGVALGGERSDESQGRVGAQWGHTMYDELLHVPLWIRRPGGTARQVTEGVSLVDVAPTLLAAAGVDPLARADGLVLDGAFGRTQTERAVIAQSSYWGRERQAVVLGRHKAVQVTAGSTPLFDLVADPAETGGLRRSPDNDMLERQMLAMLPPAGSGVTLQDPPSMTMRIGRLLNRFVE